MNGFYIDIPHEYVPAVLIVYSAILVAGWYVGSRLLAYFDQPDKEADVPAAGIMPAPHKVYSAKDNPDKEMVNYDLSHKS